VVIGVGSFAPLRNAMNRSGAGGIEVSPTSSLQLPTASSSANVPPPNTRRPRIANLLTGWGSARPKTALGIPAPRCLFKRPFVIELSGRREAHPEPQKAIAQPVQAALGEPKEQQLASQTVRERFQAELGRRVGPHERQGGVSRDRAHVDDATARHLEERQEGLRDSNDADQVHLEDPPQLVEREQLERTG